MRKMAFIAGLTIGFLIIPFLIHAEIYKWIDDNGTIHLTDDYGNIPPSYRERLKVERMEEVWKEGALLKPPETIVRSKEEQAKEGRSMGEEDRWGEELAARMEQLEEATANFESAQKKFLEKSEELSRRKFGSPTMYKFDILKLNLLNAERMKFKAQVEEADKRVRKFSKPDFWAAASITGAGKVTDIYGIGEDWWGERVRPWREKLKELRARYENAEKSFMEKAEDLSRRGYGNRHTIKAKIIELDRSNREVLEYEAQIAENEGVLERISKDAEESEADPDWLK